MSVSYCQTAQQETKNPYTQLEDMCLHITYTDMCMHTHTHLMSDHYVLGTLEAGSHSLTVARGDCLAEPQHTQQKGLKEGRGFLI